MLIASVAALSLPAAPFNATEWDVAGLVANADVDRDGKLNFDEFKKAIVTARKLYEPALVEDKECLCKVQSAFEYVDLAADELVDADELAALLEDGAKRAAAAATAAAVEADAAAAAAATATTAAPETSVASPGETRRKLQIPYTQQYNDVIQQWMKGVYTVKPDPYSYIPKAENKLSPPPPPGVYTGYDNWPLLKPRWEGQTREQRWWEVWGLANGGKRVDANGHRLRPGNAENMAALNADGVFGRGKVRNCEPETEALTGSDDDDDNNDDSTSSTCINVKSDDWCAQELSQCGDLWVYTNCMKACNADNPEYQC